MTTSPRLRFALERLTSGDWLLFERFAAEFLVSEFPTLRTTANPSGDGGRDGEVFLPTSDPRTGMQYSVTAGWAQKIRGTVSTLNENHPNLRRLIYCTSREIGAKSDDLRAEMWDSHGVQLDIRDASWFADRESETASRYTAGAELAAAIVDPYLHSRELKDDIASPLTREDSKVALLQLSFNSRDGATERSLTRSTFDALVLAALHGTTSSATLTSERIVEIVSQTVPGGTPGQVKSLVGSAITRLSAKSGPVTKRGDTGEYHVSHGAAAEWEASAVEYLLDQQDLESDLAAAAVGYSDKLDNYPDLLASESRLLRGALESVLLANGERFVEAIEDGNLTLLSQPQLAEEIASLDLKLTLKTEDAAAAICKVLAEPSERSKTHLVRVLEAYTLFAFLQATPDVQKSLSRIFAGGEVWLDASAVLPLLGELLIPEAEDRGYTTLLAAARGSGVKLWITEGMIEEVERHLNLCLTLASIPANEWRNRVPFVYAAYILSGRAESQFPAWVADIRGSIFPLEDVAMFLEVTFGIRRKSLAALADAADTQLRGVVKELWMQSHETRRARGLNGLDPAIVSRLVEHDVENVVGIMQLRRSTPLSPLGHTAWWLTMDGTAFKLPAFLADQIGAGAPTSPVLSPDFLAQMLRFGPLRRHVEGDKRKLLPLTADITHLESVPRELLDLARTVRQQHADYSEMRIRREVRDALERARTKVRDSDGFSNEIHDRVKRDITAKARN